jgi:hypothetical protein
MSQQITLDNHTFNLIHRTNKKIKNISLSLENKDEILIKTPLKFKAHKIKEIAYEHKEWILRSIKRVPAKNSFDFVSGGTVPFLGSNYPMILEENENIKNVKFSLKNDMFLVQYNKESQSYDDFIDGLKRFYKYNAIKIIDPIFDEWTHITKLYPNKIGYRFAKTRWGSCSVDNNISINYKLLQFDKRCIEYVVLHELCHIKEKNHSKKFWDLVSFYMPEYKKIELRIRNKLF